MYSSKHTTQNWQYIIIIILFSIVQGCTKTTDEYIELLLSDDRHGNQTIQKLLQHNLCGIDSLYWITGELACLDYMTAPRVALLLALCDDPVGMGVARQIFERPNLPITHDCKVMPRIIVDGEERSLPAYAGAFALGYRKQLSTRDIKLLGDMLNRHSSSEPFVPPTLLISAIGLGELKEGTAILEPYLLNFSGDETPVFLLDAVALIGDTKIVSKLRRLFQDWMPVQYEEIMGNDGARTYDLGPRLLRCLVLLGDYTSIDLYIERMSASGEFSIEHLNVLKRLTGQNHNQPSDWKKWRRNSGKEFQLSSIAIEALRGEVRQTLMLAPFTWYHFTGYMPKRFPYEFSAIEGMREVLHAEETK